MSNLLTAHTYSSTNANPANPANVHQENTQTLATLATLQLEAPAKSEVISNWWLVHFVDHDSLSGFDSSFFTGSSFTLQSIASKPLR